MYILKSIKLVSSKDLKVLIYKAPHRVYLRALDLKEISSPLIKHWACKVFEKLVRATQGSLIYLQILNLRITLLFYFLPLCHIKN